MKDENDNFYNWGILIFLVGMAAAGFCATVYGLWEQL